MVVLVAGIDKGVATNNTLIGVISGEPETSTKNSIFVSCCRR
jgi:hypothetical protein